MENKTDNSLYTTLKKMVAHCQEMQKLLETDIHSFSKNDLPSVGESNTRKTAVIAQLNASLSELNMIRAQNNSSGIQEVIDKGAQNSGAKSKQEIQNTLNMLKTELTKCYQYLLTNNNIVFTNIQQLKDVWDQLLAFSGEMNCVYDHTGSTKR